MKKLTLIIAGLVAFVFQSEAHNRYSYINSYADAIVFDEMGITFAVYPDGEFDFYFSDAGTTTVSNGYVNATFNSGYDYSPYVQYDDYGAVLQVENVPVYYDWYGRVSQIGDVQISYQNRRLHRVGGLVLHYNSYGHYAYHSGYINVWNPYFVYRPFYVAFVRPSLCFVNINPYRQYYAPVRYTYYRPYVQNVRPCYATVGHTYSPSGHVVTTHHRYSQSAGRGEIAVRRERQTVTRAMETQRPSTVNRAAADARTNSSSTYGRTSTVQRDATGVRKAPSTSSSSGRSVQQTTSQRKPVTTQSRTVQSAPSRNNTGTTVNRNTTSNRPNTVSSSKGNSNTSTVNRGGSSQVQKAPTRATQSSSASRTSAAKAPTSRSSSTTQRAQSSSSSRSSVSKPSSSSSRTTTSRSTAARSSSSVSKAPSRSSSSSASKGTASRSASKRGN
jgi:hypothetical protein